MIKTKKYRAEKILYPDGIGCSIWEPWGEDEDVGLCYDFKFDDIDEIITLLHKIKNADAEAYEAE